MTFTSRELSQLPMTLRVLYILATSDVALSRGEIHSKLGRDLPRDKEITRPLRDLRRPWHGFDIERLQISQTEHRYRIADEQKEQALKVVAAAVAAMKMRRAA